MEQQFFKLLKYSNELKRSNKYLGREDPEAFDTLIKFLVTISENLHYSEKQEYITLAKDFLGNKIIADEFSYFFILLYEGIGAKLDQMKREESLELGNFLNKTDRCRLNGLLPRIYASCYNFRKDHDFTMAAETELKDYAQILLLKLQDRSTDL